jgi:hypothetical protein
MRKREVTVYTTQIHEPENEYLDIVKRNERGDAIAFCPE